MIDAIIWIWLLAQQRRHHRYQRTQKAIYDSSRYAEAVNLAIGNSALQKE